MLKSFKDIKEVLKSRWLRKIQADLKKSQTELLEERKSSHKNEALMNASKNR